MIFEDPDELGYFTSQEAAKARRPASVSTLTICNLLLTRDERDSIVQAALHEFDGYPDAAEAFRFDADYHNLNVRPDAD